MDTGITPKRMRTLARPLEQGTVSLQAVRPKSAQSQSQMARPQMAQPQISQVPAASLRRPLTAQGRCETRREVTNVVEPGNGVRRLRSSIPSRPSFTPNLLQLALTEPRALPSERSPRARTNFCGHQQTRSAYRQISTTNDQQVSIPAMVQSERVSVSQRASLPGQGISVAPLCRRLQPQPPVVAAKRPATAPARPRIDVEVRTSRGLAQPESVHKNAFPLRRLRVTHGAVQYDRMPTALSPIISKPAVVYRSSPRSTSNANSAIAAVNEPVDDAMSCDDALRE